MSQQHFSEPPSVLARRKDSDGPKKQTREEYKQAKELEELRKAGNAPAEVDESGKDINPHIPKYMIDVPWYVTYDHSKPTLKHQRWHDEQKIEFDGLDKWYERGQASKTNHIAVKYRPGACENCGAMGHKRKDCVERPRKRISKFGGNVVAADDAEQPKFKLSFDGKRDRWNGVDMEEHQEKMRLEFEKLEEARRLLKSNKLAKMESEKELTAAAAATTDSEAAVKEKKEKDSDDEEEDEFKYADEMDAPGQQLRLESKQRISVRNLRMREDTAKYLLNLDPNSAYYDPKSRSMRDNPLADKEVSNVPYVGDNFVRYSGQANKFAKSQMFAWDASEKGVEIHQQADPTKLEMLHKEFRNRYDEYAKSIKETVMDKYGGNEHLDSLPKELVFAQTESYMEYNRYGNVIKSQEKAKSKSKYIEDELVNNHTCVWGSYFKDARWGYKCCKSLERNSYCTGSAEETKEEKEVEASSSSVRKSTNTFAVPDVPAEKTSPAAKKTLTSPEKA